MPAPTPLSAEAGERGEGRGEVEGLLQLFLSQRQCTFPNQNLSTYMYVLSNLPSPHPIHTFSCPLSTVDVDGSPHEVMAMVPGLPYGLHCATCPHLVHRVASDATQCGKLENIGAGTSSASGCVHLSICHASLQIDLHGFRVGQRSYVELFAEGRKAWERGYAYLGVRQSSGCVESRQESLAHLLRLLQQLVRVPGELLVSLVSQRHRRKVGSQQTSTTHKMIVISFKSHKIC